MAIIREISFDYDYFWRVRKGKDKKTIIISFNPNFYYLQKSSFIERWEYIQQIIGEMITINEEIDTWKMSVVTMSVVYGSISVT